MNSVTDPLTAWVLEDPHTRAPLALGLLGALLAVPLVIFAVYIFRLATRAIEQQQFPPAGYRMLRTVEPVTGVAAERQGRIVRAMAILLIAGAIALAALLWRLGALITRAA